MEAGAGLIWRRVAWYLRSGSPRVVKYTGMPALILTTSASETSALTVTRSRRASITMVGAVWLALTVRPSSATTATTVPSTGAVMRV
ncbi:hypothetical protein D3C77_749260 [compost metagenome]